MELIAEKRKALGKQVKTLRNEGKVPAVVFGKGMESIPVTLSYIQFRNIFEEVGETSLIDVVVEGKGYKVLVKNVSYDPVTDKIKHVDLYMPDLTRKVEVQVPVEVVGEEECVPVKNGEGVVLTLMQGITISALPTELIDEFVVDVSKWENIDDHITIGALEYDREKVEIVSAEEDEQVVKIDHIMQEEEEEEVSEEDLIAGVEASEEKEGEVEDKDGEDSEKAGEEKPSEKTDSDK